MTEYIVQQLNLHGTWDTRKTRFNLYEALMDVESMENEMRDRGFPNEKFRIFKGEPIQRKRNNHVETRETGR